MELHKLLGTWGRPPDAVAWGALVFGAWLLLEARSKEAPLSTKRFVAAAAFGAAFLSLGYIAHYLRGGPRIIDATTYFLQGRTLSHGHFTFPAPEVSASFRGRFLLFSAGPDRLAGIFPPGYPLLLAPFFWIGAPMLAGPLLAAALAVVTYHLALELLRGAHGERLFGAHAEAIARGACMLSLLSAALRYHTADTMSHGASALGIALALLFALRGRRTNDARAFALAGLAAGYVLATRIPSSFPILLVAVVLAARTSRRSMLALCTCLLPGAALLLAAQHASTGHLFESTQRAYYAVSDGPPGCFRYGFGAGVGCLHEHGDFVRARLPNGYGLLEALGTTLRRLKLHAMDVTNFEPLSLLAFVPLLPSMRQVRAPRVAWLLVLGQVVAYAPFYFDGNYPGGGGRLFADVLPIEHALVAIGVAHLARRWPARASLGVALAVACLGFAVHASHDHLALANRDGARPMFEPDVLREAQVSTGLLFVDTDHGFGLAHDPRAKPDKSLLVARAHGDDHDRLLFERLGRPAAHSYRFADGPKVVPYSGVGSTELWTFETEADWPPLAQSGGWAAPVYASGCPGRVLLVAPTDASGAAVRIELPVPRDGKWSVSPRVMVEDAAVRARIFVLPSADAPTTSAKLQWTIDGTSRGCVELEGRAAALRAPSATLLIEAAGPPLGVDRIILRATP